MGYVRARLLGVNECTQYLNIGRTKFYDLLQRGEIKSVYIDGRRLVPVEALHAYVDRLLGSNDAQ